MVWTVPMNSVRASAPQLADITPYDPKYLPARAYLSANENPCDVETEVRNEIKREINKVAFNRYPDPLANELRDMIAEANGLLNAHKHDSQDICFVPDGDYAKFIEQYTGRKSIPGDFVDTEGNILGKHKGIIHYTLGQRRGLGIPAASRLYVCDISPKTNQVVLGNNEDLFHSELTATKVNLISCESLKEPMRLKAKIRYRHPEQEAVAWQTEDGVLHVRFDKPQRAITRGQAVVLYDGDIVVGGGVIENCIK